MATIVFKTCGGGSTGAVPVHFCSPCQSFEKGRVRGLALIDKSIIPRAASGDIDAAQVLTLQWWNDNVLLGKIIVIPDTSGTFDGGSVNNVAGYGDVKEVPSSKTYTLVGNDSNHAANADFWDSMERASGQYHIAWRTGSELRISDDAVSISVADNTEDDVDSNVVWAATITWTQSRRRTVQVFDIAPVRQIFNCFEIDDSTP